MARMEDIPAGTREAVAALACPPFPGTPWVAAAPLARRTVAILTSLPAADIVMSHISINYDRVGFARDINVAYPIDRLRELAAEGVIGRVAPVHFSVMGSTDPTTMGATVDAIAARAKTEGIDAILLCPV